MDLIHFSEKPFVMPGHAMQAVEPSMKPVGLWVSDESTDHGWKAWCEAEEFRLEQLIHQTRISLRADHQVKILTTADEIIRWTDDYGGCQSWSHIQGYGIDWFQVAKQFQGVIITPYQWSLRWDRRTSWYYSWDCASGCIWDMSAIVRVEVIQA